MRSAAMADIQVLHQLLDAWYFVICPDMRCFQSFYRSALLPSAPRQEPQHVASSATAVDTSNNRPNLYGQADVLRP